MSKLYKHHAWLPLSKLAATWAPELEFDQDELASLLMKKMFGGEVDNLEPDPKLNGSNRGVFVIDPETREVLPVRGRLVLHHLTNNPDHTVAKSSQAFYQRDLVGLTRQATLKLAAALDWPPPSYWQPPSLPHQGHVSLHDLRMFLNKPDIKDLSRPKQQDLARTHFAPKRVRRSLFRIAAADQPRLAGLKPTK